MMQPIEFRAWNGFTMSDPFEVHEINARHINRASRLLQYVGKKDFDNKKVFNGDILVFPTDTERKDRRYVVRWNDEDCCWSAYMMPHGINAFKGGMVGLMRVVGNEYENPELLEILLS